MVHMQEARAGVVFKQVSNQEMRSKFRFSLTPVSKTLDRDDSLDFNKDDQK